MNELVVGVLIILSLSFASDEHVEQQTTCPQMYVSRPQFEGEAG